MSEGDSWVHKAVYDLSLLLRDPEAKSVQAAEEMVRRFCTKELRGVRGGVGGVEEYIANAALDLVIMAVWSLACNVIAAEPLPVSPCSAADEPESLIKTCRHIRLQGICGHSSFL